MSAPEAIETGSEERFAVQVGELAAQAAGSSRLAEMLEESHSVYAGEPPPAVTRMRGWILVLLARQPLPEAALPFVLEELETAMDPYLLAASAAALRAWPEPNPGFVPMLRRAWTSARRMDSPVDLGDYGGYGSAEGTTSPVRELLLTLAWMGPHAHALRDEIAALRQIGLSLRWQAEWHEAFQKVVPPKDGATDCCGPLPVHLLGRFRFGTPNRKDASPVEEIALEDQDGLRASFGDRFRGKPAILAFFYTRCDNPSKCSLTLWKLARVQKHLESLGMSGQIRTAAITYDPAFDTPARLRQYGTNRGLRMDESNGLLRAVEREEELRRHFELGVSFFESLVSRHRIEVYVLDKEGRVAAAIHRLDWKEEDVAAEAIRLLEPQNEPGTRLALGPAAALTAALIPKCPVCWAAYLSALGITGLSISTTNAAVQTIVALLLLANLASIYWRSKHTGTYLPLFLAIGGTAAVSTQFGFHLPYAAPLGAVLLTLAAVRSATAKPNPPINV